MYAHKRHDAKRECSAERTYKKIETDIEISLPFQVNSLRPFNLISFYQQI